MTLLIILPIITILIAISWFISEFTTKKKWLRCLLGISALILCAISIEQWTAISSILKKFNYNAYYGFASKQLVNTTIERLESGETETVLKSLKKLQEDFRPTYETKADYCELVSKAVKDMNTTSKDNSINSSTDNIKDWRNTKIKHVQFNQCLLRECTPYLSKISGAKIELTKRLNKKNDLTVNLNLDTSKEYSLKDVLFIMREFIKKKHGMKIKIKPVSDNHIILDLEN